MFSTTGISFTLSRLLSRVSGSHKFKMADVKPEVHVSMLIGNMVSKVSRLYKLLSLLCLSPSSSCVML